MQDVMDSFDHSYEASAEAIGRARTDVARFAAAHGMHARRIEDVRLAVSEAVTNAVRHAYRGATGTVHVTAHLADGGLWISVRDFGGGMRPRPIAGRRETGSRPVAGHREMGSGAIGSPRGGLGLGLALIGRLAGEMSVTPQPDGGTELRMRFALMAGPARTPSRAIAVPV